MARIAKKIRRAAELAYREGTEIAQGNPNAGAVLGAAMLGLARIDELIEEGEGDARLDPAVSVKAQQTATKEA